MFMPLPSAEKGSFRDGRSTSRANETGLGPNNSLAAIRCCMSERPSWAAHRADKKRQKRNSGRSGSNSNS